MKNKKHTEDCIDANDDTSVFKGKCICPSQPQHTPTPWKVTTIDGTRMIVSHEFYEIVRLSKYPSATEDRNAAFIVRAVNAHEIMLNALKTIREVFIPTVAMKADATQLRMVVDEAIAKGK